MAERVRKLSPEEVAAQGLVDLLHVEKAKLGVTDKDLRAWRPAPATTAPPRTGPTLAIVGNCEGCRYLHGAGDDLACRHPDAPPGATPYETLTGVATAHGCPEQGPARLALARAIVAEGDRKGAATCPRREETWERMTQHARLMTALPSPCTIPFGSLRISCNCGAGRGVTCADHYAEVTR